MLHDFAPVYKIVQECFADVHELQRGVFSSVKKLTEYLRVGYVTLYGVSETKVNARTRYVYTL